MHAVSDKKHSQVPIEKEYILDLLLHAEGKEIGL
jgi:hypothetical protein